MSDDYYHTKASVQEYITAAKDVNGAKLIERLGRFLPNGSTLLELGTGPGTDWKLLNENYNVTGSDLSLEFLEHLNKTIQEGEFLNIDAATIDTKKTFDGIYSNKVLHHLQNEKLIQSIRRQADVIEPGGIICHSFWRGTGSETFKGLLVKYHTKSELTELFGTCFDVLLLESYAEFEEGDSLLLIARKKT